MSAPARVNPQEFLKNIVGKPVMVKLNSGVDYRGKRFFSAPLSLNLGHSPIF
jgi:hypothetical protein